MESDEGEHKASNLGLISLPRWGMGIPGPEWLSEKEKERATMLGCSGLCSLTAALQLLVCSLVFLFHFTFSLFKKLLRGPSQSPRTPLEQSATLASHHPHASFHLSQSPLIKLPERRSLILIRMKLWRLEGNWPIIVYGAVVWEHSRLVNCLHAGFAVIADSARDVGALLGRVLAQTGWHILQLQMLRCYLKNYEIPAHAASVLFLGSVHQYRAGS